MPNNTSNVVGTDGHVPVYDPNALWTIWSIHQIYTGQAGDKRYVPKLKDYVIIPETFETFIVDALDSVTLIPTLVVIRPANMTYSFTEADTLFGIGPGTQADTFRVYIDKSVTPYNADVDARLKIAGNTSGYMKLFVGVAVEEQGTVVSKMYDSQGTFISENVPLEVAAIDSHTNYAIKITSPFKVTADLKDGEIVTAVFYSSTGRVISKRQLLVENTSFIRRLNSSSKYITSIGLESPFLSATMDKTIEFPLNIPVNALNLIGVVNYSNGEVLRLPVNGTKFRMFGLDQYLSSIPGQPMQLGLNYSLSPDEVSYAVGQVGNNTINQGYNLVTINPNNSYSVKLFCYPQFIDDVNGYQLRWWLLNLDRNIWFDATEYVQFDLSTGPYNPKGYGYLQKKTVSVNLKTVSSSFKAFVHVQTVEIVLNATPNNTSSPWTVSHEYNTARPGYGNGLFGKRVSSNVLNLSSDIALFSDWNQKVYLDTYPLVNTAMELNPPAPTHFVVMYGGVNLEFPINQWNVDLNMSTSVDVNKTVYIRFIKRTSTGDLQLTVSAMIIK